MHDLMRKLFGPSLGTLVWVEATPLTNSKSNLTHPENQQLDGRFNCDSIRAESRRTHATGPQNKEIIYLKIEADQSRLYLELSKQLTKNKRTRSEQTLELVLGVG